VNLLMDAVECGARSEEVTQSGAKVKVICAGIMLPVERSESPCEGCILWAKLWKCSYCGREVK